MMITVNGTQAIFYNKDVVTTFGLSCGLKLL